MSEKKIKYVELEIVGSKKNKRVSTPKIGVFTGYKKELGVPFIRIAENHDTSFYFSTTFYNIKVIKIVYPDTVEQELYSSEEEDQDEAIEVIKGLILHLREDNIADKDGGIDLEKYTDLPVLYLPTQTNTDNPIFGQRRNVGTKRLALVPPKKQTTNKKASTSVYKTPEKEVTYIRRRTKKPSIEFLADLKKKVRQISEGIYKSKDLPKIIKVGVEEEPIDYNLDYLRRQEEYDDYYEGYHDGCDHQSWRD